MWSTPIERPERFLYAFQVAEPKLVWGINQMEGLRTETDSLNRQLNAQRAFVEIAESQFGLGTFVYDPFKHTLTLNTTPRSYLDCNRLGSELMKRNLRLLSAKWIAGRFCQLSSDAIKTSQKSWCTSKPCWASGSYFKSPHTLVAQIASLAAFGWPERSLERAGHSTASIPRDNG